MTIMSSTWILLPTPFTYLFVIAFNKFVVGTYFILGNTLQSRLMRLLYLTILFEIEVNTLDSKNSRLPNVSQINELHADNEYMKNSMALITLINGTDNDIRNLSRDDLVNVLWAVNKMSLDQRKKQLIWNCVRRDQPLNKIKANFLKRLDSLVLSISQPDLFKLNMSDLELVSFLGEVRGFKRRQLGVLAFSLQQALGDAVMQRPDLLNRIKSLLCGFPPLALHSISPLTFLQIDAVVFHNLQACTLRQLRALLAVGTSAIALGPPSAWSSDDTHRLGLLIKGLQDEELRRIRPRGMPGILPDVIQEMSPQQLVVFRTDQVQALSSQSLAAYRRKTGITSGGTHSRIIVVMVLLLSVSTFSTLPRQI